MYVVTVQSQRKTQLHTLVLAPDLAQLKEALSDDAAASTKPLLHLSFVRPHKNFGHSDTPICHGVLTTPYPALEVAYDWHPACIASGRPS